MSQTSSLEQQMKHRDRDMVPRVLVQAMFGLMAFSLIIVAYAQWADVPNRGVPAHSDIVAERSITLTGTRSDGITVRDETGAQIAYSGTDKAGFIDVIWNAVMRERTVNNADLAAPVRLVRRANGHTAILDDTTGWSIELIGYGQDNVAAFAKLID